MFERIRILVKMLCRVNHAEKEHPAQEWQAHDISWAVERMLDEAKEVDYAIKNETNERVEDECLDVMAVCFRILRRDYKSRSKD